VRPTAPNVRLRGVDPAAVAATIKCRVVAHWQSVGLVLGAERLPHEADGSALFFVAEALVAEALVAFAVTGETRQFRDVSPEGAFNAVVRALYHPPAVDVQDWRVELPRDQTSETGVALLAAFARLRLARGEPLDRALLEALASTTPPSFTPDYFPEEAIGATDAIAWLRRVGVPGFSSSTIMGGQAS
jgi:hypothetical protein